ncbi:uncharacterized protein YacL [Oikeobacillus pervagus]|uniref:Uncharacterized protein YacL n=1 Tax=Oikeobacillus pervagus TaxID=1325931 RepID=A0AAJ1SWU1_9BACI|nr:uncharacterized protein YacL [Oikeobacillus pervagus]
MKKVHHKSQISDGEFMISVASIVIGVGVFQMPRLIAENTIAIDGVFVIILYGIIVLVSAWMMGKIIHQYPRQPFFEISSTLIKRPFARILTIMFGVHFALLAGYEIRIISIVTQQYLLPEAPLEIVALLFLFVIQYALFSSSITIIRLNALFFPIVMIITIL